MSETRSASESSAIYSAFPNNPVGSVSRSTRPVLAVFKNLINSMKLCSVSRVPVNPSDSARFSESSRTQLCLYISKSIDSTAIRNRLFVAISLCTFLFLRLSNPPKNLDPTNP